VPRLETLEQDHLAAAARELPGGRGAHRSTTDHEDVDMGGHPPILSRLAARGVPRREIRPDQVG
jgi:hypothetical protein